MPRGVYSIEKRGGLFQKGENHPRYWSGKKREKAHRISNGRRRNSMSFEQKLNISNAVKGKNNHNWKGGISPISNTIRRSLEYRLWRTAVFERDNYTCIWCGDNKGGNLNADHIKPFALFPELRFAIDNGRTLCIDCHKTTDTYAGLTRF